MAVTLTLATSASGVGGSISAQVARTGDGGGIREVTLPQAYTGTLTTRTDADTGEITLTAGHGITTGMTVDVYWDGGVQYDVTVGTVATNACPIDSGSGDDLPSASTAVVVAPVETANVDFEGDNLSALSSIIGVASAPTGSVAGHVQYLTASPSESAEIDMVQNVPRTYDVTGGDTNPFAGESVATIAASCASTTGPGTLKILWVETTTT